MTDYEKSLDVLWRKATTPRKPNAFTAASLFAGCGGSLLGSAAAGFRELLAVEKDGRAVAVLAENFPSVQIYHGDIASLTAREALKISGLARGDLDLLDMSPPCTGFSMAGNRIVSAPVNQLWRHGARLLEGCKPRVFVMENIDALTRGKMCPLFEEILAGFRAEGYRVEWQILDASLYGVPQKRLRVIVRGVRNDLVKRGIRPTFPVATGRIVTVADAFAGLPSWLLRIAPRAGLARIAHLIPPGKDGEDVPGHTGHWNTKRLKWDAPAPTLCASAGQASCCMLLHPELNLGISVREAMRLQGFPDGFRLAGGYRQRIKLLGNSVPPLLAFSIGFSRRHTGTPWKFPRSACCDY